MSQQPPQNNNFLLFLVMICLFMMIWIPLRQRIWPDPPAAPTVTGKEDGKKDPAVVKLPVPTETPEAKLLTLGDAGKASKYNLRVVLDPLGGGVRSVKLNKFRAADEDGRPVLDEEGMDLVPGSANLHEPSHLLYHFPLNDKDAESRPLDTLGRRTWDVVTAEAGKVAFRTTIDGVVITKTYTLHEGDYHLGLQVDLTRPMGDAVRFRYQLTGAKGLPVEGKWYTSIFRNAMVGLEDDSGAISRVFQDLRQIDLWGGGTPVLRVDREEAERQRSKEQFIRYAGIGVQYFASVIAVDEQANKKFLRRATPSLETAVAKGKVKEKAVGGPVESLTLRSDDGKTETTIYVPADLKGKLGDVQAGEAVAVIYQTLSWDPALKECPKLAVDLRVGQEAQATHAMWENDISVRVTTEPVALAAGETVSHKYVLYNGPVKPSQLGQLRGDAAVAADVVERYSEKLKLYTLTDYQSPGWAGNVSGTIGWSKLVIFCTNVMHKVLGWLTVVIPSYGLSIIALTLLVRMMMFPLSLKQAAMGQKMQALQPELKLLAEKHKDDKAAYAQAQMELFRKNGVNPLGSCWVVLLQMPIFMGLYFALQESIQFRLASFWPTWIVNLAAPDMLFGWGRSIWLISRDADYGGLIYLGPYFNLLPLFAVALMVVQQKLMMPPPADKEQEFQQKIMRYMMIVMGIFFYKIAAGLCIYIITSTLWGFAERKFLPKAKAKPAGFSPDVISEVKAVAEKADVSPLSKKKAKKAAARAKKEEVVEAKGLGQRLSAWWNDVLEQAKKK